MSEYRLYSTEIWETRLCSSEMRGCNQSWFSCVLKSNEQLGPDEIWTVFGEWVKLGLVWVLVGQIRFRLCLSDRSGWI